MCQQNINQRTSTTIATTTTTTTTTKLSLFGAGAALMNGSLGTTILYISYIFAIVHYNVITFLLLGVVTVVATGTYIILSVCKMHYESNEYYELVSNAIHPYVEYFTILYSVVYIFECCIAYLAIIGEQLRYSIDKVDFISNSTYTLITTDNVIFGVLLLVVLPLLLTRNLWFMTYSSIINLISALYIMVFLIAQFIKNRYTLYNPCSIDSNHHDTIFDIKYFYTIITAVSSLIFGYRNHIPSISIFDAMIDKTLNNFIKVTVISVLANTTIYAISGFFGYSTFCESTKIDILLNFHESNYTLICSRIAAAIILITSYIMATFSSRIALHKLMDWIVYHMFIQSTIENAAPDDIDSPADTLIKFHSIDSQNAKNNVAEQKNIDLIDKINVSFPNYMTISWVVSGSIWFLSTYFTSKRLKNGTPVLASLGGLSCYFSFIIPGVCLLRLIYDVPLRKKQIKILLTTIGWLYIVLGFTMLSTSLMTAFKSLKIT